MPGARIVVDGLWRCLCPSVDAIAVLRALQAFSNPRRPSSPHCWPKPCQQSFSTSPAAAESVESSRPYGHAQRDRARLPTGRAPENVLGPNFFTRRLDLSRGNDEPAAAQHKGRNPHGHQYGAPEGKAKSSHFDRYADRKRARNTIIPRALLTRSPTPEHELDRIDTRTLVDTVRDLQNMEYMYSQVVNIVQYLILRRGQEPSPLLYECLIRANTDRQHGSALVVWDLWRDMEIAGIMPTAGVYHAILDVLAVHPDYVLRNTILFDMQQAWLHPTVDGSAIIVLGLLRDGQHEKALDELDNMRKNAIPVPPWLYDIFIFNFGGMGMHEETLMLLQAKLARVEDSVSLSMWSFLLDVFSKGSFYDGVKYVWNRVISPEALTPSDGVVLEVLNVASRERDAGLAMEAIQRLSQRGKKLELHHFEPLLEIHTARGNVQKAFLTLCLMHKAGLQPDSSSARPVFQLLCNSPERAEAALESLGQLRAQHDVPIAAFNVLIEVAIIQHGVKQAVDLYRSVRRFCSSGPDPTTFKLLLDHTVLLKTLRFILAEMKAMALKPDEADWNRIVLICSLRQGDKELAFKYLEQMKAAGWQVNRGTALGLIRRCIYEEDPRAEGLIEACQARGWKIDHKVRSLIRETQAYKRRAEERRIGYALVPWDAAAAGRRFAVVPYVAAAVVVPAGPAIAVVARARLTADYASLAKREHRALF